ncbi:MAG: RNA polymerase sigma factor [Actinomycetota bacterium]|nr:RNA polymerase sigma factor [Actinomycetota bacterium]
MGRNRIAQSTEDDLVEAARRGDRVALNELLERNFDLVQTICRRVLWRPYHADALEQARQEALLRIARGIGRFNAESRLSSWIHRIATNAALDALKRYDRTPHPGIVPEQSAPVSAGDTVTTRIRIDQCLEQLQEQYRQPVVLCFLCDLDYDEIAAKLDLPVGTVKSRIHRGRATLKHCLGEGDGDSDDRQPGTIAGDKQSYSVVTSALEVGR